MHSLNVIKRLNGSDEASPEFRQRALEVGVARARLENATGTLPPLKVEQPQAEIVD